MKKLSSLCVFTDWLRKRKSFPSQPRWRFEESLSALLKARERDRETLIRLFTLQMPAGVGPKPGARRSIQISQVNSKNRFLQPPSFHISKNWHQMQNWDLNPGTFVLDEDLVTNVNRLAKRPCQSRSFPIEPFRSFCSRVSLKTLCPPDPSKPGCMLRASWLFSQGRAEKWSELVPSRSPASSAGCLAVLLKDLERLYTPSAGVTGRVSHGGCAELCLCLC